MPFFIRGKRAEEKKRKKFHPKGNKGSSDVTAKKQRKENDLDEEITSEEDEEYLKGKHLDEPVEEEDEEETAQEKKVRLAKQYLKELQEQKAGEDDSGVDEDESIGQHLREEVLEAAGKLHKKHADTLKQPELESLRILKCKQQKLPITCVVISPDDKYVFSASKDCSIVKYNFLTGEKIKVLPGGLKGTEDRHIGHTSHIYSLAISSDGIFLASGDKGGYINIWNAETLEHLKRFKKHRGAVSGLAFRRATHNLYSASHDRLVMVWNLDAMAFVENLGGHQDAITGIDANMRESCITCGGRDQSVIVYVVVEDKQLRFTGHQNSIDGVKLINDKTFITFGQDGSICLWSTVKKRPHFTLKECHGLQQNNEANWITAVTTLVNSDLLASGSMDGFVRLWKVDSENCRFMTPLFAVPVKGVVNSLTFSNDGNYLVAGLGQEHKLGRWYTDKSAKNNICIIPLNV